MPENITVYVNGGAVKVPRGSTAAVAVLLASGVTRTSVSGQPRAPLCGMGTCFECRVEINRRAQRRSCLVLCEPNMEIKCCG
jgi:aerobic-type carbon monoxide dehydrogenase small subunit (CoxS/CutS family)